MKCPNHWDDSPENCWCGKVLELEVKAKLHDEGSVAVSKALKERADQAEAKLGVVVEALTKCRDFADHGEANVTTHNVMDIANNALATLSVSVERGKAKEDSDG